jgi:S-DNA-T family DNA segregation ATPase FtsK/SpoIIIE
VARLEDGGWFRLRLLDTHVLVAGATDAGKGSVLWSVLHALAPAIHAGTVRVTGLDPKGMELYIGAGLFTRLADDDTEDMVAELEAAAKRMQVRKAQVKAAGRRKFVPSVAEPFELIVIDELAFLTAYTIPALRKRVEAALSVLLSQGRAPGFSVLGLVQDPRKDVVNLRNLFPVRIALRLAEESETDMVLGDGSADRGARCHEIPLTLPGVGYVRIDGNPEPRRIRFPFHDDDDIRAIAARWAAAGSEPTADVITLAATRPSPAVRVIPLQRNDSRSIDTDRPAGQEG